jgi:DNA replication protein DnaC
MLHPRFQGQEHPRIPGRISIAVASNLPFSEWGTVIPDPRLVAAIVDRVTFNAHILETGTDSYRLRTTRTRRKTT